MGRVFCLQQKKYTLNLPALVSDRGRVAVAHHHMRTHTGGIADSQKNVAYAHVKNQRLYFAEVSIIFSPGPGG
jgi:acyl-CoA synthetase (NDP forming)